MGRGEQLLTKCYSCLIGFKLDPVVFSVYLLAIHGLITLKTNVSFGISTIFRDRLRRKQTKADSYFIC